VDGVCWRDLLRDPEHPGWARREPNRDARLVWHLGILAQLCNAIAFAHSRGFVHRDMKPDNVMVGEFGEVYLIDWGVAVAAGTRARNASGAPVLIGTPAYMAPEMALGEDVDARADLYALGCVAYYLLTGEQVFTGDSVLKVITQHLQAVPVPPSERTELPIPAALEHLVLACLAKKPEDRPQTARQLAQSLDGINGMTWGEEEAGRWWSQHHRPQALASPAITL
jgi:serine/threonine protein kinase